MGDEDTPTAVAIQTQLIHDRLGGLSLGGPGLEFLVETSDDLSAGETTNRNDHSLTGMIFDASCALRDPGDASAPCVGYR